MYSWSSHPLASRDSTGTWSMSTLEIRLATWRKAKAMSLPPKSSFHEIALHPLFERVPSTTNTSLDPWSSVFSVESVAYETSSVFSENCCLESSMARYLYITIWTRSLGLRRDDNYPSRTWRSTLKVVITELVSSTSSIVFYFFPSYTFLLLCPKSFLAFLLLYWSGVGFNIF